MVTSETGLNLSHYIANYKGGRNESFMYGSENETIWYDYDLISAYTTVMAKAGHPLYENIQNLTEIQLNSFTPEEILYSYILIKCDFEFQKNIKFPSIPCFVDETTTVYPLKGSGILTGAEYLLAKSQNCEITIKEIIYIPFSSGDYPFKEIIKELQEKRREHPKNSISNFMYKEIANSIYGSVVRGMSDRRKFDIKTGRTLRMEGSIFSNPLIAS